jgi:hypothetical protein
VEGGTVEITSNAIDGNDALTERFLSMSLADGATRKWN